MENFEYKETLLKVKDVSLSLGGVPILKNLNLEVKDLHRAGYTQGQVVGLLGPTGVGKTSLFRLLAGLQKPDTGSVLLEKEGVPVHPGMVGVVAQNYPLFAHRTVRSNLLIAADRADVTGEKAKQRANELLKRFGLEEHGAKYPSQLSGGQRQRAAIAQQFMCSKHFLLMDEPFSGLDLVVLEGVLDFIREMARSDELRTFILVTHDVSAAMQVADTIWLLGRDRDPSGKAIPGARIQATYNLMERGLAWRENTTQTPEFLELYHEIKAFFPRL